ncbi:MAG: CtsR family transcriptional regulator [Bacillota bacterium]
MPSIADKIQQYLEELLEKSRAGYIEIQRNRLAEKFVCVPSQINYVLNTRFTIMQGYLVESRQGGGGYLKITKLPVVKEKDFIRFINQSLNEVISEMTGEGIVKRLYEEGIITGREMLLMRAIMHKETLNVETVDMDAIRAKILKSMLLSLMREEFQNK